MKVHTIMKDEEYSNSIRMEVRIIRPTLRRHEHMK